jgi:hypothetical protein
VSIAAGRTYFFGVSFPGPSMGRDFLLRVRWVNISITDLLSRCTNAWFGDQRRLAYDRLASLWIVYLNLFFLLTVIVLPVTAGLYGMYGAAHMSSCSIPAI